MGKVVSGEATSLVALLVVSMFTGGSPVAGETDVSGWEKPIPIDIPGGGDAASPVIAMSADGTAMVVWLQAESRACSIHDVVDGRCPGLVWAARFVPSGGWTTPVLIGEVGGSGVYLTAPRIAMDPTGRAVALWANDTLWANHFTPGVGWGSPVASPWDLSCCMPWSLQGLQVLLDRTGVAVMVWWGDQDGPKVWAGQYVPDHGWGEPFVLASNATRPRIAMDEAGNSILAVWHQGVSLGARRFTPDSGWGVPSVYQLLEGEVWEDVPKAGAPVDVAIARDGTAVVTWTVHRGGGNTSVWAASLAVNMTWSEGFELERAGQAAVGLVVNGTGTATVLYTNWGCGYGGIHPFWVARFVPGNGWETPSLATDVGSCYGVEIVGDAAVRDAAVSAAAVVWGAGTSAVFRVQHAAGEGWGMPTRISDEGNNTWSPNIAANPFSGEVLVVWMQWTGGGHAWDLSNVSQRRIYASQGVLPLALRPRFSSPQDGSTTSVPTVTVAGWTRPGATLVVNGIYAAVAFNGSFSFRMALEEGPNTITAVATDIWGATATSSVRVTYLNPMRGLEEELQDTRDSLADARLDLGETNDALAEARSALAVASQNVVLMLLLQLALAVAIAVLFVLHWQERRGGPGTVVSLSRSRRAVGPSEPGRGAKSQSVTHEKSHRSTTQADETFWPSTPRGSRLHLTMKERIALHLLDYARHSEGAVVPPELTQEGIAKAAGFNRRHFSQNIRRLVREGLVEERMAHVEGALQRQRVYSLTQEGWKRTIGVRDRIISVIVPLDDKPGDREASIEDILANAHGSKSLLDVVRESAKRGNLGSQTKVN